MKQTVTKIIHIDMDAFFVSVEIRDNPALQGKPVAVGGKSSRRGVISTCNYIARQYGVSSAMATSIALQKCPELIVVPGRMDVYKQVSVQIRDIFAKYTDKIEPLSLDEAFLDLTLSTLHHGSATLTAKQILEEIYQTTSLTASAGIAPIKFLAKIASDLNKPNGMYTITPNDVLPFIEQLPLKKIPGVGKVTSEKLTRLGLLTGGDVRQCEQSMLMQHFGKFGRVLWERCQGIDNREVVVSRIRKSVGVERTLSENVSDLGVMRDILLNKLLPELHRRSESHLQSRQMNKLGVKVKFDDFTLTTKEQKSTEIDPNVLTHLLDEALDRGAGKTVRLLGVHIGLTEQVEDNQQLSLSL